MKVNLIATHQIAFQSIVPLLDCLGVLALASTVRKHCSNVDCEVTNLMEFGDMGTKSYEQEIDRITDRVASSNCDVLGLSTMSNNLIVALDICRKAKKRHPALHTVLGGPGVSFCAADVVKRFPQIDTVIRGEADFAFPDFLNALSKGDGHANIDGIVQYVHKEILDRGWPKPIENLDQLPIPLYKSCFNYTPPANSLLKHNSVSLEIGRGCPFSCSFCSTSHFFKRKFRLKSIHRVLKEISIIQSKYGDKTIIFNHDLLTFNHPYLYELSQSLQAHKPAVNWGCSARLDYLSPRILDTMRKAGCERIFLGIEVATPKMQKIIRKNLDLAQLSSTLNTLVRLDYGCTLSFIVGFPGEERSDIEALLSCVLRTKSHNWEKIRIQIHALAPECGSDLYSTWKDKLKYDKYGSPGTSDLPVGCKFQRAIIQKHPHIFPTYFYIADSGTARENVLKLTFLAGLIELKMTFSLQLAFFVLGTKLPAGLVEKMQDITLPPANSFQGSQPLELMNSVRRVVKKIGQGDNALLRKFDTIAQYELAVAEILEHQPKARLKIICVDYNPEKLIEWISTRGKTNLHQSRRYCMVFWDEEKGKPRCAHVPKSFANLVSQ